MTVTALAGAAMADLPGKGAQDVKPAFGLGFRFSVRIDGVDLGGWQSCGGLKVEFQTSTVKPAGNYLVQTFLPERVVYPKVVLKRAIDRKSAEKVQKWLNKAARDWFKGVASNPSNATITMYDSNEDKVIEWTLSHARPVSWSSSDLDANSSKVAIETLELVHEGLEVKPAKGRGSGPLNTSLPEPPELKAGNSSVKFRFAPEKVQVGFSDKKVKVHNDAGSEGHMYGVTNFTLSGLILEGPTTKTKVHQLITWATPVPKETTGPPSPCPPPAPSDGKKKDKDKPGGDAAQPEIEFKWGPDFDYVVQIVSVSADYTRFNTAGGPRRAVVSLKLQLVRENSRPGGSANPTSGGLSGRDSHVVTDGDTLPLLAREHYGDPAAWRDIAAANDIDDPLRVHAGRRLYLPAVSELTRGRPA